MKYTILFLLITISNFRLFSQPKQFPKLSPAKVAKPPLPMLTDIGGKISGLAKNYIYLSSITGNELTFIDSIKVGMDGSFSYKRLNALRQGQYRLFLDGENYLDLLFTNEKIKFNTSMNDMVGAMNVSSSRENQCYYYYLKKMRDVEGRLAEVYENHPEDTALLSAITDSVIKAKNFYSKQIISEYPGTLASRIINAYMIPVRDFFPLLEVIKYPDRMSFLAAHFFDNINFADTNLVRTDVFYTALQYYMDNLVMPKDEEHFITSADMVMAKAKNGKVYEHVLKVMMDGFEQSRQELAFAYLSEKYYLSETCDKPSDNRAKTVKEKVAMLRMTSLGAKAPALSLPDPLGNTINLLDQHEKFTLIVFWTSRCHHCESLIPQLIPVYNKYHRAGFQVYGVSIDSSVADWKRVSTISRMPWLNVNASGGMAEKQLQPYNLHGTPKMLVMRQDGIIVFNPRTFKELASFLETKFGH